MINWGTTELSCGHSFELEYLLPKLESKIMKRVSQLECPQCEAVILDREVSKILSYEWLQKLS